MNAQIVDPYAAVESRRIEMINDAAEEERALQKRISDSSQRVLDLRADADKLARGFQQKRADVLRTEATHLEDIAKTLRTVDLPKLRRAAEDIRMSRHPELTRLAFVAEGRIRSNQEDQKRAALNALIAAKDAFYEHLARLAPDETLGLAQAVAAAELAAGVEHEDSVQVLIRMLGPKAAA
jgi:hypothetical protein